MWFLPQGSSFLTRNFIRNVTGEHPMRVPKPGLGWVKTPKMQISVVSNVSARDLLSVCWRVLMLSTRPIVTTTIATMLPMIDRISSTIATKFYNSRTAYRLAIRYNATANSEQKRRHTGWPKKVSPCTRHGFSKSYTKMCQ